MKKTTIKKISHYNYQLTLKEENEVFLNSIFEILKDWSPGAYITKSTENGLSKSINFFSHSVKPLSLSHFQKNGNIDYYMALNIIRDLYKQHSILENYGYGFYYLDFDDIFIINDSNFICINPYSIKELNGEYFKFFSPLSFSAKHSFFSPEILDIHSIPAKVHFKCFYYSLGALTVYCLFGEKIYDYSTVYEVLKPIVQTKLYWLLLKTLDANCERRSILMF